MGATVLLYDRYDQLVRQALTNEQGKFAFGQLTPDLYSIRVTLASFVPAMRRNIAVAAGSRKSAANQPGDAVQHAWIWFLRAVARHADERRLEVGAASFPGHPAGAAPAAQ